MSKKESVKFKGSIGLLREGRAVYVTVRDPKQASLLGAAATHFIPEPRDGSRFAMRVAMNSKDKGAKKLMPKAGGKKCFELLRGKRLTWLWDKLNSEGFATVDVDLEWFPKEGVLYVPLPATKDRKPVSEARATARATDRQMSLKLVG